MKNDISPFLNGANKVEDIVEYSSDLKKVSFGGCNLDVFLQTNPIPDSVESVSIEECKFSHLTFLNDLDNLTELYVRTPFKSIVSMTDLSPFISLRSLSLYECKIEQIQGLENLVNLERLILPINKISKIEGLENLHNLRLLALSSNNIKKVERLGNLTALGTLDLDNNQIKKLEGLDALINLKELYLNQNYIRVIEGLGNLKKLEKLDLGANLLFQGARYVSRQELMKYIGHLPKLKRFNQYRLPFPEKIYLYHNQDY
jgi:Leucine-rich repeat (LRR) protein